MPANEIRAAGVGDNRNTPPHGRHLKAQGNALVIGNKNDRPEGAKSGMRVAYRPFGAGGFIEQTQGVALGYHISAPLGRRTGMADPNVFRFELSYRR
jgi:hypothetical protein